MTSHTAQGQWEEHVAMLTRADHGSWWCLARMRPGGGVEQEFLRADELADVDVSSFGGCDAYLAPNGFSGRRRSSGGCREVTCVCADVDLHSSDPSDLADLADDVLGLVMDASPEALPTPTEVVLSGRGVHLYWCYRRTISARLRDGSRNHMLDAHEAAQERIYGLLRDVLAGMPEAEVDGRVSDLARLMRAPGSVNSKSGTACRVAFRDESALYSPSELAGRPVRGRRRRGMARAHGATAPFGPARASLARKRARLLEVARDALGTRDVGHRATLTFLYYNEMVAVSGADAAMAAALRFSSGFAHPIPERQVRSSLRSQRSKSIRCCGQEYEGYYPYSNAGIARCAALPDDGGTLTWVTRSLARGAKAVTTSPGARRAERERLWAEMRRMHGEGMSNYAIARALGVSRVTVGRVLARSAGRGEALGSNTTALMSLCDMKGDDYATDGARDASEVVRSTGDSASTDCHGRSGHDGNAAHVGRDGVLGGPDDVLRVLAGDVGPHGVLGARQAVVASSHEGLRELLQLSHRPRVQGERYVRLCGRQGDQGVLGAPVGGPIRRGLVRLGDVRLGPREPGLRRLGLARTIRGLRRGRADGAGRLPAVGGPVHNAAADNGPRGVGRRIRAERPGRHELGRGERLVAPVRRGRAGRDVRGQAVPAGRVLAQQQGPPGAGRLRRRDVRPPGRPDLPVRLPRLRGRGRAGLDEALRDVGPREVRRALRGEAGRGARGDHVRDVCVGRPGEGALARDVRRGPGLVPGALPGVRRRGVGVVSRRVGLVLRAPDARPVLRRRVRVRTSRPRRVSRGVSPRVVAAPGGRLLARDVLPRGPGRGDAVGAPGLGCLGRAGRAFDAGDVPGEAGRVIRHARGEGVLPLGRGLPRGRHEGLVRGGVVRTGGVRLRRGEVAVRPPQRLRRDEVARLARGVGDGICLEVAVRVVIGNSIDGRHPAKATVRSLRMGATALDPYEVETADLRDAGGPGPSSHEDGGPASLLSRSDEPLALAGACLYAPLSGEGAGVAWTASPQRVLSDERITSVRTHGLASDAADTSALSFRVYCDGTNNADLPEQGAVWMDNASLELSGVMWEFNVNSGDGSWYQLHDIPNREGVRVCLPEATNHVVARAVSCSPEEWVQAVAVTPRPDRYGPGDVRDMAFEPGEVSVDGFGRVTWPQAVGGHGTKIYELVRAGRTRVPKSPYLDPEVASVAQGAQSSDALWHEDDEEASELWARDPRVLPCFLVSSADEDVPRSPCVRVVVSGDGSSYRDYSFLLDDSEKGSGPSWVSDSRAVPCYTVDDPDEDVPASPCLKVRGSTGQMWWDDEARGRLGDKGWTLLASATTWCAPRDMYVASTGELLCRTRALHFDVPAYDPEADVRYFVYAVDADGHRELLGREEP